MISALRWAAMRAIFMFHNCEGQSQKTASTHHNFWRERRAEADSNRGPSSYQLNALPLGQTGSHYEILLLIAFIQRYSPLSSRLTELTAWDSTRVTNFYSAFLNIHRNGVLSALAWLVPRETAAVSARSVYTIQPCTMSLHAKPHT